MKNKIFISLLVLLLFIVVILYFVLNSNKRTYTDYQDNLVYSSSGSEEYEYIPNGTYCELIDFNTFTDDEIELIQIECDKYIDENGLYDESLVTCSFYGKNEDGSIKINIIGTPIYFDITY